MRILITGANRGIGLEMVRQYLQRSDTQVIATCRSPESADALQSIVDGAGERAHIHRLDVVDAVTIEETKDFVSEQFGALDILINNAGVNPPGAEQTLANIDVETLSRVFDINTIAPLMIAQYFLPLLRKGQSPRIANISTQMGSITNKRSGGFYAYGSSKAALNFITRAMANDLQPDNVLTVAIHPGWVKTDMGGPNASLTPEQSAQGVIAVIDNLTVEQSGLFFNWNGEPHPW